MTRIIKPEKNRLEVADILRKHIGDYQNQYRLWPEHKKIVSDLLKCRTVDLGGHIDRCDNCGTVKRRDSTTQIFPCRLYPST
jgi:hypothetical protein